MSDPYVSPPPTATKEEQIDAVLRHFRNFPCPGCLDAVKLLKEYRAK